MKISLSSYTNNSGGNRSHQKSVSLLLLTWLVWGGVVSVNGQTPEELCDVALDQHETDFGLGDTVDPCDELNDGTCDTDGCFASLLDTHTNVCNGIVLLDDETGEMDHDYTGGDLYSHAAFFGGPDGEACDDTIWEYFTSPTKNGFTCRDYAEVNSFMSVLDCGRVDDFPDADCPQECLDIQRLTFEVCDPGLVSEWQDTVDDVLERALDLQLGGHVWRRNKCKQVFEDHVQTNQNDYDCRAYSDINIHLSIFECDANEDEPELTRCTDFCKFIIRKTYETCGLDLQTSWIDGYGDTISALDNELGAALFRNEECQAYSDAVANGEISLVPDPTPAPVEESNGGSGDGTPAPGEAGGNNDGGGDDPVESSSSGKGVFIAVVLPSSAMVLSLFFWIFM